MRTRTARENPEAGGGAADPAALLPPAFGRWFASRGWTPRAHQLELLAKAQAGRSVLLIAPTGAGKTLAGFLPSLVELSAAVPRTSLAVSSPHARSAPSPLVGEGWGGGWPGEAQNRSDPPPCPSPTRGEGTLEEKPVSTAIREFGESIERRRLISAGRDIRREGGLHTLYISPLKALAVDIARNLERPVAEMGLADPHRDPHRRHARQQAPAPAPRSAANSAHHARAARAHSGVGGRALSLRLAPARRARRTARAGDQQARRSALARARAAVCARARSHQRRSFGNRGRARRSAPLPRAADCPAARSWPIWSWPMAAPRPT